MLHERFQSLERDAGLENLCREYRGRSQYRLSIAGARRGLWNLNNQLQIAKNVNGFQSPVRDIGLWNDARTVPDTDAEYLSIAGAR